MTGLQVVVPTDPPVLTEGAARVLLLILLAAMRADADGNEVDGDRTEAA